MRADLYLFSKGHAESRQKAQRLIKEGAVLLDGVPLTKPSEDVNEDAEHLVVLTNEEKYVGRGGLKLEAALDSFAVAPKGLTCADIGASTGGFTDCLLQNGAAKVYAIDSGRDQLHPKVASDERVVSIEGYNARYLKADDIGEQVDLAVMDVSFISQTIIIPSLVPLIKDGGMLISLVKPQFEAGRGALGKNGIVKSPKDRYGAVIKVLEGAELSGLCCKGFIRSPIKGGDGNEEYLLCFVKAEREGDGTALRKKIKDVIITS